MELKPGHKRTEVGVIPEEWEVTTLPDVCWFQEGPGLRQWQFTTAGMKVINVTNLENGVLNLERTDRHISMPEFSRTYQHFAIDAGDIVMASSGNSYSKTSVVRHQDLPLVMNTSVIRFKPGRAVEYGFMWALLNSWIFKEQIDLMITGGAQPNFGPYHLKRVHVPVPPIPEQRAVAKVLGDVDALIGALIQLIAKKRDLKQAAMQQLITGRQRLPGFHREWEVKAIGDIFDVTAGGDVDATRSNIEKDERHCFPIYSNTLTDFGLYGYCSYNDHQAGSITVTARGTLGVANYRDHDFTAIGRVLVLYPKSESDGRFFAEVINN